MSIESCAQEFRPVVRLDTIERIHHILERKRDRDAAAVVDPEEVPSKIVQRPLPPRLFANQGIGVEPKELAFRIVVLAPLPAPPRQRPAHGRNGIVGRVLKRPPLPADPMIVSRRRGRQSIQGLLFRQ